MADRRVMAKHEDSREVVPHNVLRPDQVRWLEEHAPDVEARAALVQAALDRLIVQQTGPGAPRPESGTKMDRADPTPLQELGAMIDALLADMPDEELAKLPADMADSVDQHLYGRQK